MQLKFQFAIKTPFKTHDRWPLQTPKATFALQGEGDLATSIVVIMRGVSTDIAPKLVGTDGKLQSIALRHENHAAEAVNQLRIFERVCAVVSPCEVEASHYSVEFIPESDAEKSAIDMFSWSSAKAQHTHAIPFDIAAKGFLINVWPEPDLSAAEFFIRGARSFYDQMYIDAFVNHYFYLERLFADGKFKTKDVADRFRQATELIDAIRSLPSYVRTECEKSGAKVPAEPYLAIDWLIAQRGFFQHQSQTDPSRWLHSTQSKYDGHAFWVTHIAQSVYLARNRERVFSPASDLLFKNTAKESRAMMKVVIEIYGEDDEKRPVRRQIQTEYPGTKVTKRASIEIAAAAINHAKELMIAVKQISARIENSGELVFTLMM
jgi:hypothetical protein